MSAWSSKEAASFLGIAPKTACAFAAAKLIPGVKLGRDWKFDETTLREWLQNKTRENTQSCRSRDVQVPRIGKSASNSLGERLDDLLASQTSAPPKSSKTSFAVLSGGKSSSERSTIPGRTR